MAAVSLQIGYPTVASVPHSIANGFKVRDSLCLCVCVCILLHLMKNFSCTQNLLAVAVATDITFKEAEQVCCYSCFTLIFLVAHDYLWLVSEASKLLRTTYPLPTMRLPSSAWNYNNTRLPGLFITKLPFSCYVG